MKIELISKKVERLVMKQLEVDLAAKKPERNR